MRAGITPEELARRADARAAALKNTIVEWFSIVQVPDGRGRSFGRSVLYAPGHFHIEVLKIGSAYGELINYVWEGKGANVRVLANKGWLRRPNYRTLPTPLAPAFLTDFSDITMRATQGARAFTTLVASGRKLGYTALVERRAYPRASELRLVLTKGSTRYMVIWDERRTLVNRVEVQSRNAKGKWTRIVWALAWGTKSAPLTANDVKNYHPVPATSP